jgi:hypothetical protein
MYIIFPLVQLHESIWQQRKLVQAGKTRLIRADEPKFKGGVTLSIISQIDAYLADVCTSKANTRHSRLQRLREPFQMLQGPLTK